MKHIAKKLLISACTFALVGSFSSAFADIVSDTDKLLNWAETTYPEIFTKHKTTLAEGPWLYRNYSEVGVLAGVNKDDNNVYVMGGPWGNAAPTIVGSLANLMVTVNGSNPSPSNQLCDASALPAGMSMTQNGNVYTITTNGCIVPPTDQNYCEFAAPPSATGIHVLTTGVVKKMQIKGLVTSSSAFDQLLQSGLDFKTCVINAPSESAANITVNTNVCYDLTALFAGIPSIPGFLTIEPPVQQTLEATATTTRVTDCFATDATSVSNLVTNEVWVKTNGTWNKISTTP